MAIKSIVKTAVGILIVWGANKLGNYIGYVEGVVDGCRIMKEDPIRAAKCVADYEYIRDTMKRQKTSKEA